ncbi:uncharacterized protein LOC132723040 [Ruditapes philippinarum]|uniref:uncharacterized protein LOC132723040 n=1 Tax=Ruditapes philippinarum TaxID=129788 RepID=UPI00295BFF27|nr:uncharacterized protein LOC132723040 [Ruditapes philippinarum]
MVLLKAVFVFLLVIFSNWVVVSSEFVSEKTAEYVTKDEMNKVLELVKIQDQRISDLKTEMTKKNMEINRFDIRVAELEMRVLEQSKKIAELEANDKNEIEQLRGTETKSQHTSGAQLAYSTSSYRVDQEHKIIEGESTGNEMKQRDVATGHYQRRSIQAQVAFSAYLSHFQDHLGLHQTIKFDKIITNDGNAYNAVTGIFTVPVTGTYVFIFYINSSNSNVVFRLMANNALKASGVSRPAVLNQIKDVQGGGMVVLRLNQGVAVWIENANADSIVYSTDENRWVTFSGFLLY